MNRLISSRWANPRTGIFAGLTLSAALIVAAVALNAVPGPVTNRVAVPTTAVSPEPVPLSTTGLTNPDLTDAPSAGESGAEVSPYAPSTRTTTEVKDPGAAGSHPLPSSSPVAPLLAGSAPKTASKNGALVTGFPSAIPVAGNSNITSSSVASSGKIVQVTLVARTSLSPAALMDYYALIFARAGFPAESAPAVGGSTAALFAHGNNAVTLTITPTKSGANYSLYGVLSTTA